MKDKKSIIISKATHTILQQYCKRERHTINGLTEKIITEYIRAREQEREKNSDIDNQMAAQKPVETPDI